MPVPELAVEYLKTLIWPFVVLASVLLFRRRIDELVGRLIRARFPGGEFEFQERLEDLKQDAEAALPAVLDVPGPRSLEILDLVREDPRLGLASLRMEIESAILSIYLTHKSEGPAPGGIRALGRELARKDIVPLDTIALVLDVLPLANQAIHGAQVRPIDAVEVAMIGVRALAQLRDLDSNNE